MTSAHDASARRDELSTSLAKVQARVAQACRATGRRLDDVRLIVVTKYFPDTDIKLLC